MRINVGLSPRGQYECSLEDYIQRQHAQTQTAATAANIALESIRHRVLQKITEAAKQGEFSVRFEAHPKALQHIKTDLEGAGYKCILEAKRILLGLRFVTLSDMSTLIISWRHKL